MIRGTDRQELIETRALRRQALVRLRPMLVAVAALLLALSCGRRSGSASSAAIEAAGVAPTLVSSTKARAGSRLMVAVDPRIELMSILFRLAGLPRYTEASTPYAHAVDAYFGPVRDHRAVTFTAQFGARFHYGFEMAPRLGAYLDSSFQLKAPRAPLPLDLARWSDANLDIYLDAVRDFAKTAQFDRFVEGQRSYFGAVEARDRASFDAVPIVDWFDAAFGPRPNARYHLVPGLLTGPMDYAAHTAGEGQAEDIYVVAHLDGVDAEGLPSPRETALPFVAHELCHTYTNPVVDSGLGELATVAKPVIDTVRDKMNAQAYATDSIVLEESVVRATVVLWVRDRQGPTGGDTEIAQQERLGFVWTRALADALDAVRREHRGALPAESVLRATHDVFAAH